MVILYDFVAVSLSSSPPLSLQLSSSGNKQLHSTESLSHAVNTTADAAIGAKSKKFKKFPQISGSFHAAACFPLFRDVWGASVCEIPQIFVHCAQRNQPPTAIAASE